MASGRLSFVLGLDGPSVSVDTACSSSLVSAHLAASALSKEECSRAIAAGAQVITRATTAFNARAGMISVFGRSHTLDARADGFCKGEGCVSISLRSVAEPTLVMLNVSAVGTDGL